MPIRADLRHYYAGPEWEATRERILKRARNRCECCRIPNYALAGRYKRLPGIGLIQGTRLLYAPGRQPDRLSEAQVQNFGLPDRLTRIELGIAHLDHDPSNGTDGNLRALCQGCHLNHDRPQHTVNARESRRTRKDRDRPLLVLLDA